MRLRQSIQHHSGDVSTVRASHAGHNPDGKGVLRQMLERIPIWLGVSSLQQGSSGNLGVWRAASRRAGSCRVQSELYGQGERVGKESAQL